MISIFKGTRILLYINQLVEVKLYIFPWKIAQFVLGMTSGLQRLTEVGFLILILFEIWMRGLLKNLPIKRARSAERLVRV